MVLPGILIHFLYTMGPFFSRAKQLYFMNTCGSFAKGKLWISQFQVCPHGYYLHSHWDANQWKMCIPTMDGFNIDGTSSLPIASIISQLDIGWSSYLLVKGTGPTCLYLSVSLLMLSWTKCFRVSNRQVLFIQTGHLDLKMIFFSSYINWIELSWSLMTKICCEKSASSRKKVWEALTRKW